jgi:purine nucleoside phosphorylase
MIVTVMSGTSIGAEEVAKAVKIGITDGNGVLRVVDRHYGHRLAHQINWKQLFHDQIASARPDLIIGLFSCGSLSPAFKPGTIIIPSDIMDYTGGAGLEDMDRHIPFTFPYAAGNALINKPRLIARALEESIPIADSGTVAVIRGPRFATNVESKRAYIDGAHVINMTQAAEVAWSTYYNLPYIGIGLVTDGDSAEKVTIEMVKERAALYAQRQITILKAILEGINGA